jgi:hypothetical protein
MSFTCAAAPFPAQTTKRNASLPVEEFSERPRLDAAGCANRLCWSESDKWAVAHICWEEARGLLTEGLASCAAAIAQRQAQPRVWGSSKIAELLRFSQFAVVSAQTRPWEQGLPPPARALAAVEAFLAGPTGPGCWGYDSFQASTPEAAQTWQAWAPDRHCILIREPQALLFFNWREG